MGGLFVCFSKGLPVNSGFLWGELGGCWGDEEVRLFFWGVMWFYGVLGYLERVLWVENLGDWGRRSVSFFWGKEEKMIRSWSAFQGVTYPKTSVVLSTGLETVEPGRFVSLTKITGVSFKSPALALRVCGSDLGFVSLWPHYENKKKQKQQSMMTSFYST